MFLFNHFRRWETHLTYKIQVALNYTAFSVSEISVFDKYQNTRLACAHVYVGCDAMRMNIPQGNCCRKSKVESKCDIMMSIVPQNTPFIFEEPLKRVTMSKYLQLTNIPFVRYQIWVPIWVLEPLLLCAEYYPKT